MVMSIEYTTMKRIVIRTVNEWGRETDRGRLTVGCTLPFQRMTLANRTALSTTSKKLNFAIFSKIQSRLKRMLLL